ncbi:MAG: DUF3429 domain-containing protein [Caulobacteraceae bacterium]|nr:DUF3429 domain-containing protein [Caulobacter sp.]
MPRRLASSRRPLAAPVTAGAQAGWLYGLAGLVPFFVAAAAMWAGPGRLGHWAGVAVLALLAYGATIISFLGGVRWGFELQRPGGPDPRLLFLSVTPQIAAWALLFLPMPGAEPLAWRFGGLLALLVLVGVADVLSRDLPQWYRTLRIPLTVGAGAALLAALAWALRHPA